MKQLTLRFIGFMGVVLFTPLFLFTFADPQLIEKSAASFIEWKLQKETNEKIDSLRLPPSGSLEKLLGRKAAEMRRQTEAQLEMTRNQLKQDAPAILATQIARMRNLDCECRKKWEKAIRSSMELSVVSLEKARHQLVEFSQSRYMEIVHKLTIDVRIFLGTNAVIFLLLLTVSFLKSQAIRHLFLPGILMLVSTLICSYFYLFEQNWFYTVIYNDYTGFGFIAYCAFVFGILCDIAFNKARVTSEILNAIFQAVGQIGNFVPC